MNAHDLKNSILQLAIQGKLVEQREEEGTSKELLKQIETEKEQLIKEKKMKIEKPLPQITEGEIPFNIPESWEWVNLDQLATINGGFAFKSTNYSQHGIRVIRISDFNESGFVDNKIVRHAYDASLALYLLKKNNILLCMTGGTVGKSYFVTETNEPMMTNQRVATIRIHPGILPGYINYTILSSVVQSIITTSKNSTNDNISMEIIKKIPISLPPLKEQKRIVAKIEELMPHIEQYGEFHSKVEELNKKFPEDIQKSILQYAIQGKLVEQREEEGTAEELYQKIQEKKAKLIKEGKIQKQKPLPEVNEEDIPFNIPQSWKWVRIGEIFNLQAGKNITSSNITESQTEENSYPCYGGNGLRGYVTTFNREGKYAIIGRQGALCGNINYAKDKFYATEHAVVVDHFGLTDVMWSGYFLKTLNLNQYATATAQPGLAVNKIINILIPLPPQNEQKRIVAKVEELMPYYLQLIK